MSTTKSVTGSPSPSPSKALSAEKRAVHNALERKRRDHIKDMFAQLKEAVPTATGDKVAMKASRAQILKRASDYIQMMRRKNSVTSKEIEDLNQQIARTKKQIAKLETLRATNNYVAKLPQAVLTPRTDSSLQVVSLEMMQNQVHLPIPVPNITNLSNRSAPSGTPLPPVSAYGNLTGRLPPLSSVQKVYLTDLPIPTNISSVVESRPETTFD